MRLQWTDIPNRNNHICKEAGKTRGIVRETLCDFTQGISTSEFPEQPRRSLSFRRTALDLSQDDDRSGLLIFLTCSNSTTPTMQGRATGVQEILATSVRAWAQVCRRASQPSAINTCICASDQNALVAWPHEDVREAPLECGSIRPPQWRHSISSGVKPSSGSQSATNLRSSTSFEIFMSFPRAGIGTTCMRTAAPLSSCLPECKFYGFKFLAGRRVACQHAAGLADGDWV